MALVLLALGACSLPSEPSEPDEREFSFDVQGTVRSGMDGGPIDQAQVVIYRTILTGFNSERREVIQTELSAADGRYRIQASFRDTHCGSVSVGARSPGHADRNVSLIFVGGREACHGTPLVVNHVLTPDGGSE